MGTKGTWQRRGDHDVFCNNFDQIFRATKAVKTCPVCYVGLIQDDKCTQCNYKEEPNEPIKSTD